MAPERPPNRTPPKKRVLGRAPAKPEGAPPVAERHRPKRALGQNFLVDPNLRRRIVEEVRVDPGGVLLEIGPGLGALTEGLAERVAEVGATLLLVELDRELAALQRERYRDRPDLRVIEGDMTEISLRELVEDPSVLSVVGNIPYNVTSPILFHLLRSPRPREILLMVQREVADRILAEPGPGAYGALTVGVRAVATVERVLQVGAGAFRPRPTVDSTVLRLRPIVPSPLEAGEEEGLRELTRALFQWRRKQLGKILRDHPDLGVAPARIAPLLAEVGAAERDRPETVSPEGFVRMARALARVRLEALGPRPKGEVPPAPSGGGGGG